MNYSSILAYVDERPGSENTLVHASALTRVSQAPVYVFDVLEALGDVDAWPNSDEIEVLRSLLVRSRTELLRLQASKHRLSLGTVSVGLGKTSVEIIRQVLLQGHDLVIKTARGRTDGRRIAFGSTAMHLVRKCPCSVWLVAPSATPPPRRLLAAINPVGNDRVPLAKKILTHAADLAKLFDAELHVLHAWNPRAESLIQSNAASDLVMKHIETSHAEARGSLLAALRATELSLPDTQVHLVLGNAVDAITSVTADQRIASVVMGSVGRSDRDGQLAGSVTAGTLPCVDCSILCVKPDGFKSPIRLD